jgi:ArsR family transcriptional regulator, zinc-responsive transcriptional repressor
MKKTECIPQDHLEQAADCFRVMAHPVRLRIVEILLSGEYCVREVAELCHTSEHQTCEHLRLLKGQGLLGCERRGRSVYYKVVSPRLPKIIECIRSVCHEMKAKGRKS